MVNIETKYFTGDVEIQYGRYPNGTTAMQLMSPTCGPVCKPTVALENVPTPEGMVLIDNEGGNEGILGALIVAGIIDEPVSSESGYHLCPLIDPNYDKE